MRSTSSFWGIPPAIPTLFIPMFSVREKETGNNNFIFGLTQPLLSTRTPSSGILSKSYL
ncbi:unnamed protein product [Linum tenue]|uniref:Uncharacterized protein n=1 Tax=Linum tenue TaxID=586396 RepID=A0AAV0RTV7_9ROSI|nr:unnamed protein product [Linum tenue]